MFKIISDTACDFLMDYANEHNITLVPLYATFDGQTYYKEQVDISHDEFYRHMIEEKAMPKSSLPSIQDFVDAFLPSVKKGEPIIAICITTFFSGSYNSACTAKDIILEDYPDAKITVINSLQNSASMSLYVYEAMKLRDDGYSYEDTIKILDKIKPNGGIIFTTETLEYLSKGGRLTKTAALITSKLNLRPILVMRNGKVGVGGFSRTRKKAKANVIDVFKKTIADENINLDDYDVTVGYCNDLEEAEEFRKEVEEAFGIKLVESTTTFGTRIGVVTGCHTGPTALGLAFMPKHNKVII